MNHFALLTPRTAQDAAGAATTTVSSLMSMSAGDASDASDAVIKAGGIDLLDLMKEGLCAPSLLVNVSGLSELTQILPLPDGGVRVGALASLAVLGEHPLVRERYAALSEAARAIASPQIRNMATVGGNLLQRPRCWYFRSAEFACLRKGGDHCFALSGENHYHAIFHNRPCAVVHPSTLATALVVLNVQIEILGEAGASRLTPLETFLAPSPDMLSENALAPKEIVTAVHLPAIGAGVRTAYLKQGEKGVDWPLVEVAVAVTRTEDGTCTRASILIGAVAPAPYRATAAEQSLLGHKLNTVSAAECARAAVQGCTPLQHNAYKVPLVETLVRRAILQVSGST